MEQGGIPANSETSQCVALGKNHIPVSDSINKGNKVCPMALSQALNVLVFNEQQANTYKLSSSFVIILVIYPAPRIYQLSLTTSAHRVLSLTPDYVLFPPPIIGVVGSSNAWSP